MKEKAAELIAAMEAYWGEHPELVAENETDPILKRFWDAYKNLKDAIEPTN